MFYKGKLLRIIDFRTIEVELNLGFNHKIVHNIYIKQYKPSDGDINYIKQLVESWVLDHLQPYVGNELMFDVDEENGDYCCTILKECKNDDGTVFYEPISTKLSLPLSFFLDNKYDLDATEEEAALTVPETDRNFYDSRMNICKSCDNFYSPFRLCKQCFCYMPIKCKFKQFECPIKLWGKEN